MTTEPAAMTRAVRDGTLAGLVIASLLLALAPDGGAQTPGPAPTENQAQTTAREAPAPKLSEDQVRQKVQDALGGEVQVLGLRVVEAAGRPAYAVKVMNPGGNYNAAFLVTTLLVDGDTGEILGQMQRRPS
ncbi:MAG: PepSY domain-containing protein, partial [Geminicoccaceae bacterium]